MHISLKLLDTRKSKDALLTITLCELSSLLLILIYLSQVFFYLGKGYPATILYNWGAVHFITTFKTSLSFAH